MIIYNMWFLPKDYVWVNTRIEQFHAKYLKWSIETSFEIKDWQIVVFVAKVSLWEDNRIFTGHSFGSIWKEKAFEKLETVAVWRALAFAWFETRDWIASKEEIENFEDNQNNPPEEVKWFNFRDLKRCVEWWVDTDILLRNHIKDNWYRLSRKVTETIQNYLKTWELVEIK